MRTIFFTAFVLVATLGWSQQISSVALKTLSGESVNSSTFKNDGKPLVISFWATWCKPCVKELNAYSENYSDWAEETGVRIIAVSTDDTRSSSRVAPYVNARGWEFDVFLDENGDFKRAMNVANVPHTFLLDGTGKIVWQHTSYVDGDEDELYAKIVELTTK